jgi:radical SAM protein with 4Fe4S-binding SPASM domain
MYSKETKDQIIHLKNRRLLIHEDLYRLKIEASMGCNRDCKFCGMTRKESHLMSMETFNNIFKQITNSIKRVEFILHGEPTLNNNLLTMFKIIKEKFPKLQIAVSTNGWRFLEKEIDPNYFFDLFRAGANIVQVSCYDLKAWETFRSLINDHKEQVIAEQINLIDLYKKHDNLFKFKSSDKKDCIFIKEYEGLNSGKCSQRRFHTFGGNVPEDLWKDYTKYTLKDFPLTGKGKTCTSLLKYLSVGAEGNVYLCCRDASHTIYFGNVNDGFDLNKFWQSETIQKFRYLIRNARRDLIPACFLCSRICYRDPLYPYYGTEYSLEDCVKEVEKYTVIKDDVLLDNLILYKKSFEQRMPNIIKNKLNEAETKYRRKKNENM